MRGKQRWGHQWQAVLAARAKVCGELQASDLETCLAHEAGLAAVDGVFERYKPALRSSVRRMVADPDVVDALLDDASLKVGRRFQRARAGKSAHVIPTSPYPLPYLAYLESVVPSVRADMWWAPGLAQRDDRKRAHAQSLQDLRKAEADLDAFVLGQLVSFPLGRAREGGQKRLAYFLELKGVYQTHVLALLHKQTSYLGNLKRREFKGLVQHCAAHPEYPRLKEAIRAAEQARAETGADLNAVRADLSRLRKGLRTRKRAVRRGFSRAWLDRLQARIDELIRRLGMADLQQMPADFDPTAEESDEEEHDEPADEFED